MDNSWAYAAFNVMVSFSLLAPKLRHKPFWNIHIVWAIGLVSLPFIAWDVLASRAGHWFFNDNYTLGLHLHGLPIEEIAFFISVPLACMAVWSMLPVSSAQTINRRWARIILPMIALVLVLLSIFVQNKGYTHVVLFITALTCIVLLRRLDLVTTKRFWIFQCISVMLFLIANTYLTLLPIITYGADAILGWRIGSIPVEDLFYNFSLLNLFLVVYTMGNRRKNKV